VYESSYKDLKNKAYGGTLWQLCSLSTSVLLTVMHLAIMARLLSAENFGEFALANILVSLIQVVTALGLGPSLVKKTDLNAGDATFTLVLPVFLGLVFFVFLFSTGSTIVSILDNKIQTTVLLVLALNLVITPIGLPSRFLLLRELNIKQIFIATNAAIFCGNLLIGISLAYFGYGIWALVIGRLATSVIESTLFLYFKPIKLETGGLSNSARWFLRYGSGLTMVQLVNQFAHQVDKLILGKLLPIAALGYYDRSQRIQQMPNLYIGNLFDSVLFAVLARSSNNLANTGRQLFSFTFVIAIFASYISATLLILSDEIVRVLLGNEWNEAVPYLKIMALMVYFQLLARMGDIFIRATGFFRSALMVKLAFLFFQIALSIAGYNFAGVWGAVSGVAVASMLHCAFTVFNCARLSDYPAYSILQRLLPSIALFLLLLLKNTAIFALFPRYTFASYFLFFTSDLAVLFAFLCFAVVIGKENKRFVKDRYIEFLSVLEQKAPDRYGHWFQLLSKHTK